MRIVVLADTHISPGRPRRLPDDVYDALAGSDAILHAGDVTTVELIHELEGFGPVLAVLGNNDDAVLAGLLPETRVEELGGVAVGMIHDSGPKAGRPGRMGRRFPECGVVVYGHSHVPFCGHGAGGQLLFNPGSPTEKRRQPLATYGILELRGGEVVAAEIVPVRARPGG